MDIEVLIDDARWHKLGLSGLADRALAASFEHLAIDAAPVELSLLAAGDERIASLNSDFRDKPAPTNVLSWPAEELGARLDGAQPAAPTADPDGSVFLGDIAIAYDTCAHEAADAGKKMEDHVAHLIVHGLLHLLGYDHIRDGDATLMERIETEILGKLGIDDPYRT